MKFWIAFLAVIFVLFGGLTAFAGGDECKKAAEAKAGCAKSCVAKASCEVNGKKVEYDLPALVYKVGDKETPCEKTALEAAKGDEKAVKFIVADKTYDTKSEAMEAYAGVLDKFLSEKVLTVQYAVGDECVACPMAAKAMAEAQKKDVRYRLASFTFDSQEKADKALAAAKKAVDGGKGCCAAKAAGGCTGHGEAKSDGKAEAKSDGKGEAASGCAGHGEAKGESKGGEAKTVSAEKNDGEKSIGCCKEAAGKVDVARAKIEAAVKAIAEVANA